MPSQIINCVKTNKKLKMERGGSSNQRQNYPTRTHRTGTLIPDGRAHIDYPIQYPQPQSFKRDPDQYMPIANVARIMRRVLPDNAKIADDAKETIQECVSEFITFVTGKANEICNREYRKTVTPDDVLSAMDSLGLHNYIEPLAAYLEKYRAQDPDREPVGNRAPYVRRVVQRRSAGPIEPPPPPEPPVGCYIPAMEPRASSDYVGLPPDMGRYFMGDGEAEFDPFGPYFK